MKDFSEFVSSLAVSLRKQSRYRTSEAYLSTSRSVFRFLRARPTLEAFFQVEELMHYEDYLWRSGSNRNTISFYMRMLQSIYHQAVKAGLISPVDGLFSGVFTGNEPTGKRAVSPRVIAALRGSRPGLSKSLAVCCDYFMLSFYLRGIPFIDLAFLRKVDYRPGLPQGRKGVITYCRRKTGTLVTVIVEPCAAEILDRYMALVPAGSPYLLPIIRRPGCDERRQYTNALRLHNKRLHRLSDFLQLDVHLTSYVSRHSWATIARCQGISLGEISEGLGHKSERTTRIYLDSFTDEALSKANQAVIQALSDC